MIYKKLGRTGLDVSAIGLGGEWLNGLSAETVKEIIDYAIQEGVNYLDLFMPHPEVRTHVGSALKGQREKMLIQAHLCTSFDDGQYKRTRDLDKTKISFEDLLKRLQTDVIDVGMIHYVDSLEDFDAVFNTEIISYAQALKKEGKIKFLGLSSHNPVISLKAIETGLIDVLMFSINPAYDLEKSETDIEALVDFKGLDENQWLIDPARQKLYATCEKLQVGITVMKALAAGSLLTAETSPFKTAMTVAQCCHYALMRPAVTSVLVGCQKKSELETALGYLNASDSEKDYSHIFLDHQKIQMTGSCMYCNHCLPCPSHIDIAEVTKHLNLAQMQKEIPETVKNHYDSLAHHAEDCIDCGDCESNCPFAVKIRENMKTAKAIFGH